MRGGPLHAWRSLPLWARWLLTIAVYAGGVVAAVLVVHDINSKGSDSPSEVKSVAEANREGRIAITQDQAPHTAPLPSGSPTVALQAAVAADVRKRISHGELTGPLQSVRCSASGGSASGGLRFACTVHSAGNPYPFRAVADERTHRLTWCKLDPPLPGEAGVPLSPSC